MEYLLVTAVGKLRNRLHRLLKQKYASEADIKLTVEEFILLDMIDARTDQILQNIAIATGKNKSVAMRMIDSLEAKGLVKRTVNPDDRRENLLSTTDRGKEVVRLYLDIEKRLSEELLSDIEPGKTVRFHRSTGEDIGENENHIKFTHLVAISNCLQYQST